VTVGVWVIVTASVVSVARYVTDSEATSFTVKLTAPDELDVPLEGVIFELPLSADRETVLPLIAVLLASRSVTVTVDVLDPFAATDPGFAETVDCVELTVPMNPTVAV